MIIQVEMLPPAEVSPNARVHWSKRHRATQEYKSAVFYAAVDMKNRLGRLQWKPGYPPFDRALIKLTFIFPNFRTRDEDNLRTRFKPGQDALVAAEIINNDSVEDIVYEPVKIIVDKEMAPRTIIELEEYNGCENNQGR